MDLKAITVQDILRTIWLTRPDLTDIPALNGPDDPAFVWWCLAAGKTEYEAVKSFPEANKTAGLDEVMPGFEASKPVPLTRAMYGLWRLRKDLQDLYDLDDPNGGAAYIWWHLKAAATDPAHASDIREDHWRLLLQPSPDVPQDTGLKISVLMRFLHQDRADLREAFDLTLHSGREAFVMWYLFHAMGDEQCFSGLSGVEHNTLMAPTKNLPNDTFAPITNFMILLWLWREDLQVTMDLATSDGRNRFADWFHAKAINELPILWAIPCATQKGLAATETVLIDGHPVSLPRAALLLWRHHEDLQDAFPLTSDQTVSRFREWLGTDEARGRFPATTVISRVEEPIKSSPAKTPATDPAMANIATRVGSRRRDGVTLVGFARGILGIGEDLRMMSRALSSRDIEHSVLDIQPSSRTANFDNAVAHLIREDVEFETCVFVLTAMETARTVAIKGFAPFANEMSIGYWPWEFSEWPEPWGHVDKFVDEIWASTTFTSEAYRDGCGKPVLRMPMAVELPDFRPWKRQRFGLPKDDFLFIFAFDIMSGMARKNPWGPVRAFLKAFPKDRGVGLVVKVSNVSKTDPNLRRLMRIAAEDPRIHIRNETLSKSDWLALLNACDCFVSLHRCEGFGRILAEAMLLEKPVIGTNFSGNTDFLTKRTGFPVSYRTTSVRAGEYPFAEGLKWANPSIAAAARRMREVLEDAPARMDRAQAGRAFIREHHSASAVGQEYERRFAQIGCIP